MNLAFLLVMIVSSVLSSTATARPGMSMEEHIQIARHRREVDLMQREAEYHKQLHKEQEKMVAALRESKKPLHDTSINPDDRDAIVALYQSTKGPKWVNNTGWLKGDPCVSPYWFGVYCAYGRVLQINLVYNGLDGSIPQDLTKARHLQVFRVYSNSLTGEIPPDMFGLQDLQVLDVNTNSLTGRFPSRVKMANLTQLILYGNQLSSGFPTVFDAPKLQKVEISSNMFTGNLPDSFSEATAMTDFVVSRNAFTGTLPASYGKLANLTRLWTFYNNFDKPTIPDSYRGMVNLMEVQADGLSGPLPPWIGTSWNKLVHLILINGWISGEIPESLCNCENMVSLRLFNNSLEGNLPDCTCNMHVMEDLEVSDNQLTGDIPDMFDGCKGMQTLYLSRNNFSGTFPPSLGSVSLVDIAIIDVSGNGLYGTIPNTINNLNETIAELAISYNMFSDIQSGVDDFFKRIVDYTCLFYNNPWSCPLSTKVPKECSVSCSTCNAKANHQSCNACVQSSDCGWCEEGNNCLEGSSQGPEVYYKCKTSDWKTTTC